MKTAAWWPLLQTMYNIFLQWMQGLQLNGLVQCSLKVLLAFEREVL